MSPPEPGLPVRGASFFPIADGGIVYLDRVRRLYGLNAPAALVWRDLSEGATQAETVARLAATYSLEPATAREWHDLAVASFAESILRDAAEAVDAPAEPHVMAPRPFGAGVVYRLLGQPVHVDAPEAVLDGIDALLGDRMIPALAPVSAEDLWVRVTPHGERLRVESGGDPATVETMATIVPDVERRIVQDIVPRVPHFLAFHGALLAQGDRSVLLSAPSGSGKTTLAIALAKAGWSLLTDEMALLDRDLGWRGLPFRPCVKSDNYDLIASAFPQLGDAMEHVRFGRRVKFLPLPLDARRMTLRTVVFPQYRPGSATELMPISPADGLRWLLAQCIYVPPGFGEADVTRLISWHESTNYYALGFGDSQSASELINGADFSSLR
ncbi:MAG: hypothetical protein JNK84_14590 [Phreatobacter sp.]|uniref:PqqD family peptide modification chaperone n=1 Tax=Phreatobacter sp. TaxID=1966341 RepID=UPI001A52C8A8|nr:PqqD family peptide modification chaperone [Phreatobacter sp.]MBL8570294.1 hypothetical protein [Phreatobacter sp.]